MSLWNPVGVMWRKLAPSPVTEVTMHVDICIPDPRLLWTYIWMPVNAYYLRNGHYLCEVLPQRTLQRNSHLITQFWNIGIPRPGRVITSLIDFPGNTMKFWIGLF